MFQLLLSGIHWHYTKAYKEIFILYKRFSGFIFHLFSIKDLLRTLFLPWQQLGERYQGGFHMKALFESLILNLLMRVVGFFVRVFVILIGCILSIILSVLFLIIIVFWTFIPFILIFLFITALKLLLTQR